MFSRYFMEENRLDKALLVSLFPFFAFILLIGVVVLHVRKGKRLDIKMEGLGIKLTLHSQDKEHNRDLDLE